MGCKFVYTFNRTIEELKFMSIDSNVASYPFNRTIEELKLVIDNCNDHSVHLLLIAPLRN